MDAVTSLGVPGIPLVGLGTYTLTGTTCRTAVEEALDGGYRHLDTAQAYGNEQAVGQGLRASTVSRAEVFVTTKVWHSNLGAKHFRTSVENSLRKLALDYVDLLLIHWPAAEEATTLAAVELLAECQHRQHARLIGVSNFPLPLLDRARRLAPLCCNQLEYHPYLSQHAQLAYLRAHDMLLTAYSPLAIGRILHDPLVRELATEYDRTPSQIALRWLVQQPHVAVIPRAASARHRQENLAVFDFELRAADMTHLHHLDRRLRLVDPAWGPNWADQLPA
jgi:2,5-diketo-D-gluconate reductase B